MNEKTNEHSEAGVARASDARSDYLSEDAGGLSKRAIARRRIAFLVVAVAWTAFDAATKSLFVGKTPGTLLGGPFFGLVDFRLVHNTGGAWGVFSGSTVPLGVFSLIVCAVLTGFFFKTTREQNSATTVALALIVAGGIGNAIDRFARGYVIDFIEFSFFSFPVFNIADCGVTCGFALLIIGLLVRTHNARLSAKRLANESASADGEGRRPSPERTGDGAGRR